MCTLLKWAMREVYTCLLSEENEHSWPFVKFFNEILVHSLFLGG